MNDTVNNEPEEFDAREDLLAHAAYVIQCPWNGEIVYYAPDKVSVWSAKLEDARKYASVRHAEKQLAYVRSIAKPEVEFSIEPVGVFDPDAVRESEEEEFDAREDLLNPVPAELGFKFYQNDSGGLWMLKHDSNFGPAQLILYKDGPDDDFWHIHLNLLGYPYPMFKIKDIDLVDHGREMVNLLLDISLNGYSKPFGIPQVREFEAALRRLFTTAQESTASVVVNKLLEDDEEFDPRDYMLQDIEHIRFYAYAPKRDGGVVFITPAGDPSLECVEFTLAQKQEREQSPHWRNIFWTTDPKRTPLIREALEYDPREYMPQGNEADDFDPREYMLIGDLPIYYPFVEISKGKARWLADNGRTTGDPVAFTMAQRIEKEKAPDWSRVQWTNDPNGIRAMFESVEGEEELDLRDYMLGGDLTNQLRVRGFDKSALSDIWFKHDGTCVHRVTHNPDGTWAYDRYHGGVQAGGAEGDENAIVQALRLYLPEGMTGEEEFDPREYMLVDPDASFKAYLNANFEYNTTTEFWSKEAGPYLYRVWQDDDGGWFYRQRKNGLLVGIVDGEADKVLAALKLDLNESMPTSGDDEEFDAREYMLQAEEPYGLDKVVDAYAACALWASTDEDEDPLDSHYAVSDIDPRSMAEMRADCASFMRANEDDLNAWDLEQIGHDLWLTRNHHGAGFWDRSIGDHESRTRLTDAAHAMGEVNMFVMDDGQIMCESIADDITKEADKAEEPKSPEQAEAGNYAKGHVSLNGMEIAIENAKGSTRSGEDKDGKKWSVTMPAHYGYIKGVKSKDEDHVDVYIGEHPSSLMVFVVNQNKIEGGFDEHKVMMGFKTKDEAIAAYDAAFTGDLGPKLRGSVVSVTVDQFKAWLEDGNGKKPFKPLEESEVEAQIYHIKIGGVYWFEYHCVESHTSCDADLWYHSHQQVKILGMDSPGVGYSDLERAENGQSAGYKVLFSDGFKHVAMEDELFDDKSGFFRPDPPSAPVVESLDNEGNDWGYRGITFDPRVKSIVDTLLDDEEEFDAREELLAPTNVKPFGYVLKLPRPSHYPWLGARWSDRTGCSGDWRAYLGDARVFKRMKTAQQWPDLEIVPVYSDPRRTGQRALDPYYTSMRRVGEDKAVQVVEAEEEEEFDPREYMLSGPGELVDYIESIGFKLSPADSIVGDIWSYSPTRGAYYHVMRSDHSGVWSFTLRSGYRTPVRGFKTRLVWKHRGDAEKILSAVKAVFRKPAFESEEEEFDPRDYMLQQPYKMKAVDLSDDIWADDKKLKLAFSWLTRIGLAPKFGLIPIHYYQQDMVNAIDDIRKRAANKNVVPLKWARVRSGYVQVFDGNTGKWVPLERISKAHGRFAGPWESLDAELPAPEDEEFDAREYMLQSGQLAQQLVDEMKVMGYRDVKVTVRSRQWMYVEFNDIGEEDPAYNVLLTPLSRTLRAEHYVKKFAHELFGPGADIYDFCGEGDRTYKFKVAEGDDKGQPGVYEAEEEEFDAHDYMLRGGTDEELEQYLVEIGFKPDEVAGRWKKDTAKHVQIVCKNTPFTRDIYWTYHAYIVIKRDEQGDATGSLIKSEYGTAHDVLNAVATFNVGSMLESEEEEEFDPREYMLAKEPMTAKLADMGFKLYGDSAWEKKYAYNGSPYVTFLWAFLRRGGVMAVYVEDEYGNILADFVEKDDRLDRLVKFDVLLASAPTYAEAREQVDAKKAAIKGYWQEAVADVVEGMPTFGKWLESTQAFHRVDAKTWHKVTEAGKMVVERCDADQFRLAVYDSEHHKIFGNKAATVECIQALIEEQSEPEEEFDPREYMLSGPQADPVFRLDFDSGDVVYSVDRAVPWSLFYEYGAHNVPALLALLEGDRSDEVEEAVIMYVKSNCLEIDRNDWDYLVQLHLVEPEV